MPNYSPQDIDEVVTMMKGSPLQRPIMVDCSHGNSSKDHNRQSEVFHSVLQQVLNGNSSICGMMLESNLKAGSQTIPGEPAKLKYGVSVTDKCMDWDTTEGLLMNAYTQLKPAS